MDLVNDPHEDALFFDASLPEDFTVLEVRQGHTIEPIFPAFVNIAFDSDRIGRWIGPR